MLIVHRLRNMLTSQQLDGLEAVNKINGGAKYDLVLMDIIMPNLDGVSATHLIRQFDNTPIIAMTSNIRSDDISMYFQHGKTRSVSMIRGSDTDFSRDERRSAEALHERGFTSHAREASVTSKEEQRSGDGPNGCPSRSVTSQCEAGDEDRRLTCHITRCREQLELSRELLSSIACQHSYRGPKYVQPRAICSSSGLSAPATNVQRRARTYASAAASSTSDTSPKSRVRNFGRRARDGRRCETPADVCPCRSDGSATADTAYAATASSAVTLGFANLGRLLPVNM